MGKENVGWPGSKSFAAPDVLALGAVNDDPAKVKPPLEGSWGGVKEGAVAESDVFDVVAAFSAAVEAAETVDCDSLLGVEDRKNVLATDAGAGVMPIFSDACPFFRFSSASDRKVVYRSMTLFNNTDRSAKGSFSSSLLTAFES